MCLEFLKSDNCLGPDSTPVPVQSSEVGWFRVDVLQSRVCGILLRVKDCDEEE